MCRTFDQRWPVVNPKALMPEDNPTLWELRILVLKLYQDDASESEAKRLCELMKTEGAADEAARLIDQLNALVDSGNLDSLPMAKLLSDALGPAEANQTGDKQNGATLARLRTGRHPLNQSGGRIGLNHSMDPERNSAGLPATDLVEINQGRERWSFGWILGIAASHLLIASLAWSVGQRDSQQSAELRTVVGAEESKPPQMIAMTACVWRDSTSLIPTIGEPICTGEMLELIEGVAELKIGENTPGEALVRIEGPAGVFIRADGRVSLQHGTLTIKTLGSGSDIMRIDAPVGEILLDGQSSAGLVAIDDVHELHLFDGRGMVRPTLNNSSTARFRLEAGEAVRFWAKKGKRIGPELFEASISSFISARSSGLDPLKLGDDYRRTVLESKPSIYWRFDQLEGDGPFYVPNEGSFSGADAKVIGEVAWRRYGENRVAEIGKQGSSSGFRSAVPWPPQSLNAYTIEMWIKPELFHHGEVLCLHDRQQKSNGRFDHSLMLECLAQHWVNPLEAFPKNCFRFVHRTPASGDVLDGSNLVSKDPYQVRTWQHLACCKNGSKVSLWINGELVAEQDDSTELAKDSHIVVGQLYVTRSLRRFIGQLDDIAIYDRCLSQTELETHVRAAGRPVQSLE